MAVSLFLENGGDLIADQSRNNAPSVNSSRPSSINSEHMLTDEEFARQMQESDQVRAPIAPKNDILAGGLFQPPTRWTRDQSKYDFYLVGISYLILYHFSWIK